MTWFTKTELSTHTITDPDSGEEATIQIRELNAGDQAAIQDSIRMRVGDNPEPEIRIGAFKLLMVEKALVSWSLDLGVSPSTIRQLTPAVFEQVFDHVNGTKTDADLPLATES
jgi:hypothetical protein